MKKLALIAALFAPLSTQAFTLQWPLDCSLNETCFIQNFVDHDTTQTAQDYTCGSATYDGHDGTDIRLRDLAAMRAGVAVRAVADGVVLGTRNNVEDININDGGKEAVKGRECGNGVNIQHADGWRTQSCHMRKGSIIVHTGDTVKAGQTLGMVGLSGQTEFPHLHLSVWKDGQVVDPFTSQPMRNACNASAATASIELWEKPVPYQQTALLNDGIVTTVPTKTAMRDTPVNLTTAAPDAPALLYWVDIMSIRAGDVLALTITAPDGSIWTEKSTPMPKTLATYFAFIGKKNARGTLPKGRYVARLTLTNAAKSITLQSEKTVTIQ